MKAQLEINSPGDLSATISITLTLTQWVEVQKAMKEAPRYGATGMIKDAIDSLATKACGVLRYDPPDDA